MSAGPARTAADDELVALEQPDRRRVRAQQHRRLLDHLVQHGRRLQLAGEEAADVRRAAGRAAATAARRRRARCARARPRAAPASWPARSRSSSVKSRGSRKRTSTACRSLRRRATGSRAATRASPSSRPEDVAEAIVAGERGRGEYAPLLRRAAIVEHLRLGEPRLERAAQLRRAARARPRAVALARPASARPRRAAERLAAACATASSVAPARRARPSTMAIREKPLSTRAWRSTLARSSRRCGARARRAWRRCRAARRRRSANAARRVEGADAEDAARPRPTRSSGRRSRREAPVRRVRHGLSECVVVAARARRGLGDGSPAGEAAIARRELERRRSARARARQRSGARRPRRSR